MYPAITLTALDAPAPLPEPDAHAHLRTALAAKVRRLEETLLSLDNLLAPQDWLDAGDGFPGPGGWRVNRPAQRTQDRTRAPLSYLNEEEWRQHVALARDLCTRNHLALGFRDHVSNFIGPVQISFVPRARGAAPALVAACTRAWAEWCEFAEWGQGEEDREEECRRRLIVEGETTLRFFVGDEGSDGLPYARHVEPELIRTPPGGSTVDRCGWGVVTAEGDDEREEGLWVCDPADVSRGREVPASEYVRVKGNVDRTVKRGLSDFLPVGEQLRKVLGLLDNMAHVARVQAAIAWWEQYPSATAEQVAAQVRLGADYHRPKGSPGSAGAGTEVTGYEAGTVVRTEGGREVKPGPVSSGTAGFEAVERMVLRGVGFRWGCPSYFSGDGDASFASVLVTGSPFVRLTQARQERVKAFACRVASRVVEFCERSGRLPRGVSKWVRAVGTCRPVVIADEEKKARTFLALYQQNCADPVEFVR
ncbi:phage portal protein, partial [Gemmata sp. JC673]